MILFSWWHSYLIPYELIQGIFGVIWEENPSAPIFLENIMIQQKRNRLFLLKAATENGLINYPYEWWHFSDGDRYFEYWKEKKPDLRIPRYGAILLQA